MVPGRFFILLAALLPLFFAGCSHKPVPLIALITDTASKETALAQLKGSIYAVNTQAQVIDLFHDIEGSDLHEAAYLVDQAAIDFPAGTVLVVAVGPDTKRPPILVRTKQKKLYLAPDNGILTLVLAREGLDKAWQLDKEALYRAESEPGTRATGSDILGPIAGRLSLAAKPATLGTPLKTVELIPFNLPHTAGQTIGGEIIYITTEGDLVTNIPLNFAPWLKEGNLLKFTLGKQTFNAPLLKADEIADLKAGRTAATYNAQGRLKIVVNKGSAAHVLNASIGETFIIHP